MASLNLLLAFAAGFLSTLSPCVLPLIPVVLGAAISEHRYGVVALAVGLATSFTFVGTVIASFGLGLDVQTFRYIGSFLLILVGMLLLVSKWQMHFARLTTPISNFMDQKLGGIKANGFRGQFGVGLLLGLVWSPCVGPTLGAATVLAAQGRDLFRVALTMFMFGIGSAVPLVLLGLLSRETLMQWRSKITSLGSYGKTAFGSLLLLTGLLVILGVDKTIEASMLEVLPQWLIDLSSRL